MADFASWSDVAAIIEHTALGPSVTTRDARTLANEVNVYGFRSAVVTPYHVPTVREVLEDDRLLVAVIGYPYGIERPATKRAALEDIRDDVDEVDLVMHRIAFADGDFEAVRRDVAAVCDGFEGRVKVIIETPTLSTYDIGEAAELAVAGGADVVKTAVGYEGPVATSHVSSIRRAVGEAVDVKASGGIATYDAVLEMVDAGADLIGTSSGIRINATSPFST